MRKILVIFFYLLKTALANSQEGFKTLVPNLPVVVGESFQVQYVIGESEKIENFKAPGFLHFRFVSGPNQYSGSVSTPYGIMPVRNIVYTLEAINPGKFMIKGAFAMINGKPVRSNDVALEVIAKGKSIKQLNKNSADINSDYILRPGEDPYDKIRKNLFLKVVVDRTSCFAGEPVLAIFKLYSRLESNSDIVKNPGFYGFTVYDMVNLSDKQVNTETMNGKVFEVHTIRKVQLFPLQEGLFSIDAMKIKNKVEFSRSSVNKKTEQEIVEGLLGKNKEDNYNENTEVFETSMHTEPVNIRVKPAPLKNKPADFDGAVGDFLISASALNKKIAKNENGVFEVTISGKGNFTQLSAPIIKWPDGIEGFEPVASDLLDKTKLPLTGSRSFRYAFVCNQPGLYQLPSVSFTFFDPHSIAYKTISANETPVEISNEENKKIITGEKKETIAGKNAKASRVAAGIVILLFIFVLAYLILHKEKIDPDRKQEIITPPSLDEGLVQIRNLNHISNEEFCKTLQYFIWNFLSIKLDLEGSAIKKEILILKIKLKGVDEATISHLQKILSECEMGMFTGASLEINKEKMIAESKEVLEMINQSLL